MIYLHNIQETQTALIPKSRQMGEDVTFTLRSTIDQTLFSDVLSSIADYSARYFQADIVLPSDLADGEYEYTLKDGEGVLSEGIIYVGEFSNPSEYDKNIIYEQYEAE